MVKNVIKIYREENRSKVEPWDNLDLTKLIDKLNHLTQGRSQGGPEGLIRNVVLGFWAGWILVEICLKCIILVTNFFLNRHALGAHRSQRPLIFNIGDLKLRDLTKLWFFKLIVHLWRHRHYVSQMTSPK